MAELNRIPKLLELLFGEAAGAARQGASARLLRWCHAFEAWLEEMDARRTANSRKQALLAWRRLLRERRKLPWELGQADIAAHAAWLQAQGYAPTTIGYGLGYLAEFYKWCGEREIDPQCGKDFNPAAGVKRPKVERYRQAKLLSRAQVAALLDILERDRSPLGRREHAFLLARLRLGVPLKALQQLRWGQLEVVNGEAWVKWRPGAARSARRRLPGEVWQAIQAWLAASGRLAGMQAESYIFTPLRFPARNAGRELAQAWAGERHLSSNDLLHNLRLYGLPAGIPPQKLNLQALRRTATRLKLDQAEGAGLEPVLAFLDSHSEPKVTRYHLSKLPALPPDEQGLATGGEPQSELQPEPPQRTSYRFKPGDGLKHGLYARRQPQQEVLAVMQENLQGIEQEFYGLRQLGRLLLERQKQAQTSREMARLGEAYSKAADRIAKLIKAEQEQADRQSEGDAWAEEMLKIADDMSAEMGIPPDSALVRQAALGGEPGLDAAASRVVEEIAALRYVLRNTYCLAQEAGDSDELVRLVELYGSGCIRLLRMVKMERGAGGRLATFVRETINQAIDEIVHEFGL